MTTVQDTADRVAELRKTLGAITGEEAARVWLEGLSTEDRQLVQRHLIHPYFTEPHDHTKRAARARVRAHESDAAAPIELAVAGEEYPFGAAVTMPIGGPFGADPFGTDPEVVLEAVDDFMDSDDPPLRGAIREAFAAGRAHAAAQAAAPGVRMNVVIDFADATRTFVYHGLRALARRIERFADRVAPNR